VERNSVRLVRRMVKLGLTTRVAFTHVKFKGQGARRCPCTKRGKKGGRHHVVFATREGRNRPRLVKAGGEPRGGGKRWMGPGFLSVFRNEPSFIRRLGRR